MANETQFWKRSSPVKTVATWVGLIVGLVALLGSVAKSYYETPMKLNEHQKQIDKLELNVSATNTELRQQRELLIEIRTDLKYIRREQTKRTEN